MPGVLQGAESPFKTTVIQVKIVLCLQQPFSRQMLTHANLKSAQNVSTGPCEVSVQIDRVTLTTCVAQLGCKVLRKKQMKLSPNKHCFKASKPSFSKAFCSSASAQEEFPLLGQCHDRHMWAPAPPAKLPANSAHSAARGLFPSDS